MNFNIKVLSDFIYSFIFNLFVGISGLYITGYLVGENLLKRKIENSKFKVRHGVYAIFIVLIFGTLIGSTVGFLEVVMINNAGDGKLSNKLFDYYFKPMFWIFIFGSIPTLISGIILGKFLKKITT